jgi:hypothetical protein
MDFPPLGTFRPDHQRDLLARRLKEQEDLHAQVGDSLDLPR